MDETVDYEALLEKYMRQIVHHEYLTYINVDESGWGSDGPWTPLEQAALDAIAKRNGWDDR